MCLAPASWLVWVEHVPQRLPTEGGARTRAETPLLRRPRQRHRQERPAPRPGRRCSRVRLRADPLLCGRGPRLPPPVMPSPRVAFCVALDGTSLRQRSSLKGSDGHPSSRLGPPPGGFAAAGLAWAGAWAPVFPNKCPPPVVPMLGGPRKLTARVCLCLNKSSGQAPTPCPLDPSGALATADPATLLSPRVSCPHTL